MADVNVNAPAERAPAMASPTHTDDQILPRIRVGCIGNKATLVGCGKVANFRFEKGQELLCYNALRHRSIEPNMIMQRGIVFGKEYTQSNPYSSLKTKKNLAPSYQGKKKATLIVIPSVSAIQGNKTGKSLGMPIRMILSLMTFEGEQYYNALSGGKFVMKRSDLQKAVKKALKEFPLGLSGPLHGGDQGTDSGKFQPPSRGSRKG
ncbi:hypothetical protein Tco_0801902 [Tanacetum coccineum]|uniref:Uncharacterized protein n=1 Tax=Tanacetum coccineum TaxID=301880 RepID=A0ABQ4ZX94_9ASTR